MANVEHVILKWSLVNRVFQDFQFRQMKKVKVFEPAKDLPRERSNLLTISNKFGLTFAGSDQTFKVYRTADILKADKVDGKSNDTGVDVVVTRQLVLTFCKHVCLLKMYSALGPLVNGIAPLAEVTVDLCLHHLALSCDELTLSVCGAYDNGALTLLFYDVRNFVNQVTMLEQILLYQSYVIGDMYSAKMKLFTVNF